MATRSPSASLHDPSACLSAVSACIGEAEASTAAQATAICVLVRTGYDTTEALRTLWAEMDALAVLRDVHRSLATMNTAPTPGEGRAGVGHTKSARP